MLSSKKLTCTETLRQVFISVQKTGDTVQSVMFLFSTKLWCPSNLLSGSISPLPQYTVHIQYTVCGGEVWGSGPQTDKHLPQSPLTSQFFLMTTFCIAFCESYLSKHYIDFILKLLWRILGSRHWRISPHPFHDLNTLLAPLLVKYSMY